MICLGWVYPPVSHWAWDTDGWLAKTGYYHDFAGSGVVHLLGANCALVGNRIFILFLILDHLYLFRLLSYRTKERKILRLEQNCQLLRSLRPSHCSRCLYSDSRLLGFQWRLSGLHLSGGRR